MPLESTLSPTTAIEAVNDMLLSIGQGTINSIESSESVDAENAKIALVNTSRSVQARGWYFNRDHRYTLQPDVNGEIALPDGALSFAPDPKWIRVVERNRKLYDRQEHTHVFPAGTEVTGSITWLLSFEDLPQQARDYIHRRAGRVFQVGAVGSQLLYQFTKELEMEALTELMREHVRAERSNAIYDDPRTYGIAAAERLRRRY